MDYFGSLDPLSSIGGALIHPRIDSATTPSEVKEEFMAIFLAQLLKETLKREKSGLFPSSQGVYNPSMFNDLFIQNLARGLVESGGFGFEDVFKSNF